MTERDMTPIGPLEQAVYLVEDKRKDSAERLPILVWLRVERNAPYKPHLRVVWPQSHRSDLITVPDDDADGESMEITKDSVVYTTPAGVIVFRKMIPAMLDDLAMLVGDTDPPDSNQTQAEMESWLHARFVDAN